MDFSRTAGVGLALELEIGLKSGLKLELRLVRVMVRDSVMSVLVCQPLGQ